MQPQIHLIDDTWIDAPPGHSVGRGRRSGELAGLVAHLRLTVTRDRGLKGIQFAAGPAPAGGWPALAGTVEIWLEPFKAGVILHHFLRLDPVGGASCRRRVAAPGDPAVRWHAKQVFWRLKDELEAGRR